jgi:hypothetical protein
MPSHFPRLYVHVSSTHSNMCVYLFKAFPALLLQQKHQQKQTSDFVRVVPILQLTGDLAPPLLQPVNINGPIRIGSTRGHTAWKQCHAWLDLDGTQVPGHLGY